MEVAYLRATIVSSSSMWNVDFPSISESLAPILVNILSTGDSSIRRAGTYAPIYANMTFIHTIRNVVDLPPILGPVSNRKVVFSESLPRLIELGT